MADEVFVFGSNLAGIHGAGAAAYARREWGAEQGIGKGRTGDAYAIPTKGVKLNVLPEEEIRRGVLDFLEYARNHPGISFKVSAIGTGLAGLPCSTIAPMFRGHPDNVIMPNTLKHWL